MKSWHVSYEKRGLVEAVVCVGHAHWDGAVVSIDLHIALLRVMVILVTRGLLQAKPVKCGEKYTHTCMAATSLPYKC